MSMALVAQHIMNTCQKDYKAVATRWSASVIRVSGQIFSNAFKRGLAFSFTVIILPGLKQLSTTVRISLIRH